MRQKDAVSGGSKGRILVVDDEQSIRELLEISLRTENFAVDVCDSAIAALEKLKQNTYDVVITDISMPEMTGIELLSKIKSFNESIVVIIVTAFGSTESAIEAMKLGAADYLTKPFNVDELFITIEKNLNLVRLEGENRELRKALNKEFSFESIIGNSNKMQEVFQLVSRIAVTTTSVLITGESGTGKELIAHAIHGKSDRKKGPIVPVNCGAIPENLMESEFFGHKRGSFTGAVSDKKGLFQVADKGTLFLDEIGEVPQSIQVKLLRALQTKSFRPVGATEDITVDVRIVCATNRDLEEEVRLGNFREDLFYRLNVIQVRLPALRERKEDIPMLANHFLTKHNLAMGKSIKAISSEAMQVLCAYNWPGNVRELENVIERAVALESGSAILTEVLSNKIRESAVKGGMPLAIRSSSNIGHPDRESVSKEEGLIADFNLEKKMEDYERQYILRALEQSDGVKKEAAKLLGISFRSLRYRIEKFGIEDRDPTES